MGAEGTQTCQQVLSSLSLFGVKKSVYKKGHAESM